MGLHIGRALLDTRVHDILGFAFLFLGWHFIDDLLVFLGFLLRHEGSLLGRELILCRRFLARMMASTFEGREEVVQKDALARLDFSSLSLGSFLLSVKGRRL